MQKKFLLLIIVAAITIVGCSKGAPGAFNEKNAPEGQENFSENEVINRMKDIKNGATPKTKPTENSSPSAKTPPPPPPVKTPSMLNINKETKNMNTAIVKTNKGTFKIKLNPEKAPLTVENFKAYASEGFFSNTIFHRVMPGFMVQGGGFDVDGKQKPSKDPIKLESDNGLNNNRGTVAMARTQVPDSATAQFFVNLVDNDFLNFSGHTTQGYGYAVFGEVIEGMDVIDEIAKVDTGNNGPHANWPKENVIIESVELSE